MVVASKKYSREPVVRPVDWMESASVVNKGAKMQSLTTDQKQQLIEIIKDVWGSALVFDNFTDALLGLLEDVPGLETMNQRTINKLTQQLWEQYHD